MNNSAHISEIDILKELQQKFDNGILTAQPGRDEIQTVWVSCIISNAMPTNPFGCSMT